MIQKNLKRFVDKQFLRYNSSLISIYRSFNSYRSHEVLVLWITLTGHPSCITTHLGVERHRSRSKRIIHLMTRKWPSRVVSKVLMWTREPWWASKMIFLTVHLTPRPRWKRARRVIDRMWSKVPRWHIWRSGIMTWHNLMSRWHGACCVSSKVGRDLGSRLIHLMTSRRPWKTMHGRRIHVVHHRPHMWRVRW